MHYFFLSALPSFPFILIISLLITFFIQSLSLTFSFACLSKPPSAPPCPSLSPSLLLSGTFFQVVTLTATVALQSPASPTWRVPFCWWISSSTSRGVGEVEGAECNHKNKKKRLLGRGGHRWVTVATFEGRKSHHGLVQ